MTKPAARRRPGRLPSYGLARVTGPKYLRAVSVVVAQAAVAQEAKSKKVGEMVEEISE